MYLGDVEIFRTSTAEPTTDGIIWTYIKEMDQYNALWKTNQKIIFDLGNLIDSTYTGSFNTTLTATFSTIPTAGNSRSDIANISKALRRERGERFLRTRQQRVRSLSDTPKYRESCCFSVSLWSSYGGVLVHKCLQLRS